ncbi:MAG: GWxTD domain-containing protein [Bacteroidota bacterium]
MASAFPVNSRDLKAFFNYCVFNTPNASPYLETYLTISGGTVLFKKNSSGKFQGKLEISIALFKQDTAFAPKKYFLLSPEVEDTSNRPNFIDQQRLSVSEGTYAMEIIISDANSLDKKKYTITEKVEISFPKDKITMSGIQILESYFRSSQKSTLTKSGFDLVPYPARFYTDDMTKLGFYCEAYGLSDVIGKDERFAFFYSLENAETKQKVDNYAGFQKQLTEKVNVLLAQFDLAKLASGFYNLVIQVKDKKNETLIEKKLTFERITKLPISPLADLSGIKTENTFVDTILNLDTLTEYIRCLWPVSSTSEREYAQNQILNKDVKQMQKYFYGFWKKKNDSDPSGEWKKYKRNVDQVNQIFTAGKRKGYSTDRGRVYLQYGTPDARQEIMSEPNTYPYEIWQYYRIQDPATSQIQTNKRFVFCNNELAGNNYELIHSEARGERFDARWRLKIMKRTIQSMNLDYEKPDPTYGNGIDENFEVPK